MRRQEHERDYHFGTQVIDKCHYMTLSMVDEQGLPYCVPLSPVRCGDSVYFHCATEGHKLDVLRQNPKVSMAFVGDTHLPPGKFTIYYECALASGTASRVTDDDERREALRLISEKYCLDDMGGFDRVCGAWLPKTDVWKISLDTVTAKSNFVSL